MRYIIVFLFVSFFAAMPAYLLDSMVMPQLDHMAKQYQSYDQTAQEIANAR
jgi:hypothetical protein